MKAPSPASRPQPFFLSIPPKPGVDLMTLAVDLNLGIVPPRVACEQLAREIERAISLGHFDSLPLPTRQWLLNVLGVVEALRNAIPAPRAPKRSLWSLFR